MYTWCFKRMPPTPDFSLLFLHHCQALVGREQAVRLVADVNVEVLHAHVQLLCLELGAVELVVSLLLAVPAINVRRHLDLVRWSVLDKCDSVTVRILGTLLPWWRLVVVEETVCLHRGLWELVLLHGHTVCQVNLELVEPGVVQSSQDHA